MENKKVKVVIIGSGGTGRHLATLINSLNDHQKSLTVFDDEKSIPSYPTHSPIIFKSNRKKRRADLAMRRKK